MNAPILDVINKLLSSAGVIALVGLIGILFQSRRLQKSTTDAATINQQGAAAIKIVDGTIVLKTEEMKQQAAFEERMQKWIASQDEKIARQDKKIEEQNTIIDTETGKRRDLENRLHEANLTIKDLQDQITKMRDDGIKSRQSCEETIARQHDEIVALREQLKAVQKERDEFRARLEMLEKGVIQ